MSHSTEKPPAPPTRRWRIAFCITELDPGGAERQLVRLATNLDPGLFEPEVICLSGSGPLVEPLRNAGIPVTCLAARGSWDARVILRLRRHLRRTRPDLVQTFLFHANIGGRIAARLARVPVVVSGIRVAERRRWQLRLDRLTDRLVDRHVCVSRSVAEYSATVGGLPAAKLVVIPNAVDASTFASATPADLTEFGFPPGAQVILFVGRLVPQKDPMLLIDAFRLLSSRHKNARLLFVGQGPLEAELRRGSADLGDRIAFADRREDVPNLLKASTCLALTSRWEGMPNVILEAMAAGTPVVATKAEGVAELVGEGEFGTIVHSRDPRAFSAALEQILRNPTEATLRGHSAQHIAREHHTTESTVRACQRLYLELLPK